MRDAAVFACGLLLLVACLLPASGRADEDYLPPDAAFRFSAVMVDAHTIAVRYAIADGYYLYRQRFAFSAEHATLGEPEIPRGNVKFDETFKRQVETYHHAIEIHIPVQASGPFTLTVRAQGCADKGLCYPPMTSTVQLDPVAPASAAPEVGAAPSPQAGDMSESGIQHTLQDGKLLRIVPLFIVLGLGLAFTPCVLPMMPILSGIIVGEGGAGRRRGFLLALIYSLGMAMVYTALGVAAGLAGEGLAAALQNAWVLGAFGILMVALALSMFDVYHLQLPAVLQTRLSRASGRQRRGHLVGVFLMGAISALIVGPCVAAPLAGALVYISQTRDVVIGGSALFALAIGMSLPLLLIGLSAGALLPRAGAWMHGIKRLFGVLLLAVALWMVSPVIPVAAQMAGWSALGIGYGAYLLWAEKGRWIPKACGIVLIVLGGLQLAGLALGSRDPWAPLAGIGSRPVADVTFRPVHSNAELDAVLAQSAGRTVMLDFYADWCVSCVEMERGTFPDPGVRRRLDGMVLLRADVTKNDADDKALLRRFGLFGPPGIVFFGADGREIAGSRVVGYQDAGRFARTLARVQDAQNPAAAR